MTDTEKIADVVVAAVRAATSPLLERVAVLEAKSPIPGLAGRDGIDGKDGAPGRDGVNGTDGINGQDAVLPDLELLAVRAAALVPRPKDGVDGKPGRDGLDAVLPARDADLSAEETATLFTDLLRKELAVDPVRMQRRILRADGSELGRVVDEPGTTS